MSFVHDLISLSVVLMDSTRPLIERTLFNLIEKLIDFSRLRKGASWPILDNRVTTGIGDQIDFKQRNGRIS